MSIGCVVRLQTLTFSWISPSLEITQSEHYENAYLQSSPYDKSTTKALQNYSFDRLENRNLLASVSLVDGLVTVLGTPGDDTIILTKNASGSIAVSINYDSSDAVFGQFSPQEVSKFLVFAGDGDDSVFNSTSIGSEVNGQNGNDNVNGGFGDDILRGNNGNDRVAGKAGDDILIGNNGHDNIIGGNGDDVLLGFDGVDSLSGNAGNDRILGHGSRDYLYGGPGADFLDGGDGNDVLRGHEGSDSLLGKIGNDIATGGDGDDFLIGDSGSDFLDGEAGNDFVVGGHGADKVFGGEGNDRVFGAQGLDEVRGGNGDDVVDGGADGLNDLVHGEAGEDTFFGQGGSGLLFFEDTFEKRDFSFGNDLLENPSFRPTLNVGTLPQILSSNLTIAFGGYNLELSLRSQGVVDQIDDTNNVFTVGDRKLAFEFGETGVRFTGSFPASLGSETGGLLASIATPSSTTHVLGELGDSSKSPQVISVDSSGVATLVGFITVTGFDDEPQNQQEEFVAEPQEVTVDEFSVIAFRNALVNNGVLAQGKRL